MRPKVCGVDVGIGVPEIDCVRYVYGIRANVEVIALFEAEALEQVQVDLEQTWAREEARSDGSKLTRLRIHQQQLARCVHNGQECASLLDFVDRRDLGDVGIDHLFQPIEIHYAIADARHFAQTV
jgi:hypothetical protein